MTEPGIPPNGLQTSRGLGWLPAERRIEPIVRLSTRPSNFFSFALYTTVSPCHALLRGRCQVWLTLAVFYPFSLDFFTPGCIVQSNRKSHSIQCSGQFFIRCHESYLQLAWTKALRTLHMRRTIQLQLACTSDYTAVTCMYVGLCSGNLHVRRITPL